MCGTVSSAPAPVASRRKLRRGSFMAFLLCDHETRGERWQSLRLNNQRRLLKAEALFCDGHISKD
jgi:hypothetical protein